VTGAGPLPDSGCWDLVVVGELNLDVIVRGAVEPRWGQGERLVGGVTLVVGGSGAITAAGAAKLDLQTVLSARVGADLMGDSLIEALTRLGVATEAVERDPVESTGASVVLVGDNDRAILTGPGAVGTRTISDLDFFLVAHARHVHVASYYLQAGIHRHLASLLDAARAAGASVSMDPNGDPAGSFDPAPLDMLGRGDLLFVNEAEALALAAARRSDLVATAGPPHHRDPRTHGPGPGGDVEGAALDLGAEGAVIVVKRGPSGALWSDGQRVVSVPAPEVVAVDSIGAGDSFAAAFVASALAGLDVERTLETACRAGALSTRLPGGTAGQADRRELGFDRPGRNDMS